MAIAGALLLSVAPTAQAGAFTLEWDPVDPSYGNVEYTVEKSNENDSPIVWVAVATTDVPLMGFPDHPVVGDCYRLKVTNVDTGAFSIDPTILKPHPPLDLNFRIKPKEVAQMADELWIDYLARVHAPEAPFLNPEQADNDLLRILLEPRPKPILAQRPAAELAVL